MDRRTLVVAAASLVASSFFIRAQATSRIWRIGVCTIQPPVPELREALLEGLAEHGYVDGRNISLAWRDAGGDVARIPDALRELLALEVDLLIVAASPAVRAAKQATKTIPIVIAASTDAVANGLVASLSHPGGNVTGLTLNTPDLTAKRLELLKAVIPSLGRVGLIVDQTSVAGPNMVLQAKQAAQALSLSIDVAWVHTNSDLDSAFGRLAHERVQGILIELSPLTFAMRGRISEMAAKERLPAIGETREFAAAGAPVRFIRRDRLVEPIMGAALRRPPTDTCPTSA